MNDMKLNGVLAAQAPPASRPSIAAGEEKRATQNTSPTTSEVSRANQAEQTKKASQIKPDAGELRKMTEELQRRIGGAGSQLEFSIDKESGESVVKVLDRATKEVIRQIPSEEMLRIARGLDRYTEGLLIDSQA